MEDSKSLDHHDDIPDEDIKSEKLEASNEKSEPISNINNELNKNNNLNVKFTDKSILEENKKIVTNKILDDNEKAESSSTLNLNIDKVNKIINKNNNEIIKEKTPEDIKIIGEPNSDKVPDKSAENVAKANKELIKENNLEENKKAISTPKSNENANKNKPKEISTTIPVKARTKPVKEPPIEKKPFLEFVNDYLIPEIKNEFKLRGKEVNNINLQKTNRPIAEDICWVIYCEINDTCNFWLSFEKDDITSLKSFSLCKNYEKPSIIESFLIDEKKITLKLIISRILQRLNGQKLIGAN